MGTNTEGLAYDQATATRASLADLWERIDGLEAGTFVHENADDDPWDELHERPLEIVYEKGSPFSVLLGFGGPNVWIECDARFEDYALNVAWGSERVEITGESIERTGAYFLDYARGADQ